MQRVVLCQRCDSTGWVCEAHPDRPWGGLSKRADACDCHPGDECPVCNRELAEHKSELCITEDSR